MLANIFDVSADVLLGIDVKNKEKQIDDIIFRAEEYFRTANNIDFFEKSISTLREGLKEYPNSYKIMMYLMGYLGIAKHRKATHGKITTEEALILTNEIIKLGEKILAECTEDRSRLRVLHHLCRAYASPEVGMTEKAIELAEKLPPTHVTREGMLADLYEGEKKIKQCRENINLYFNHLIHSMEFYNNIEKDVIITKKIVNLIEIMIEDGNYGYFGFAMFGYYSRIAIDYAKSNDYDKAIENLQLSSDNAIRSDTEYKGYSHEYTSLLLRGIKNIFVLIPEGSYSGEALKEMKNSAFDPIRENKAFIEIKEKLKIQKEK
jgi:tetratricopeptide (TPR) repeat protein